MKHLSGTDLAERAAPWQRSIPSFDVAGGNLDILHAVCSELAARGGCAFLASTPASIQAYHGLDHFLDSIAAAARRHGVRVAAHLDHASDLDFIDRALDAGCRSVMYDGSALPLARNRENTSRVVARAVGTGASVEAEIGVIGGKEDEVDAAAVSFPTPSEAREFAASTRIDFLAPAIGTVHGFFPGSPGIRWDLARELAQASPVPVVLHGATGLDDDTLRRLVGLGYAKVNFATGVRAAFLEGIRQCLTAGDAPRPQEFLRTGRESVGRFVAGILEVLRR